MEDQRVPPPQLLERQVAVVATLGEVVATVTGSHRDVRRRVSPVFLHAALGRFTQSLCETLEHGDVTSLGYCGVPSLGRALAALEATPEACDNAIAAVETWRKMVDALGGRWGQLAWEAAELCAECKHAAPARAGDPRDEATHRGTAWGKLVAAVRWPTVDWEEEEATSVGATRDAWEAAATSEEELTTNEEELATKEEEAAMSEEEMATNGEDVATNEEEAAMSEEEVATNKEEVTPNKEEVAMSEEEVAIDKEEAAMSEEEVATNKEDVATNKEEVATSEAVVAASQARVAARRGRLAEAALGPLERLVAACDDAIAFTRNMEFYLWEINVTLKFGDRASRRVLEALVAEFQQLWDASARLFREYLLETLELIDKLLLSPHGGPGGPSGPISRAVDKWCRDAIRDIPRLLWGQ